MHKDLVPANGHDWATIFLLVAATALAAGGGIGGGGLLVPIYRLVAGFPITQATALSLATISGGSIANLYTYTRRYHPNESLKRPLIDYEASLLFCPALLAGTMFGSVFSVSARRCTSRCLHAIDALSSRRRRTRHSASERRRAPRLPARR